MNNKSEFRLKVGKGINKLLEIIIYEWDMRRRGQVVGGGYEVNKHLLRVDKSSPYFGLTC